VEFHAPVGRDTCCCMVLLSTTGSASSQQRYARTYMSSSVAIDLWWWSSTQRHCPMSSDQSQAWRLVGGNNVRFPGQSVLNVEQPSPLLYGCWFYLLIVVPVQMGARVLNQRLWFANRQLRMLGFDECVCGWHERCWHRGSGDNGIAKFKWPSSKDVSSKGR
jgi:hypothetical protein